MKNIEATTVADILVNKWCCQFGIPENILTDGGTQYRSKLLDLIYEYLDINPLKTTARHPECNGQSERTVQTIKAMIRAHIDNDQENWDINLDKFSFAYNTATHSTTKQMPFELMFCRKPRIPIDILIPIIDQAQRDPIIIQTSENNDDLGEVSILEDIDEQETNKNIPKQALDYLIETKRRMEDHFQQVVHNRDQRMKQEKQYHDRRIKKKAYEVGEFVLCDHPKLKKGHSRGIAHKYYGPFEIVKKNPNNIDYYIREVGKKRPKVYQIHHNRLKKYFIYENIQNKLTRESESDKEIDKSSFNHHHPLSKINKSSIKSNKTISKKKKQKIVEETPSTEENSDLSELSNGDSDQQPNSSPKNKKKELLEKQSTRMVKLNLNQM